MTRSLLRARSRWLMAGIALVIAALVIARCHGDRAGGEEPAMTSTGSGAGSRLHGVDPRAQVRGSIAGSVKAEAGGGIAGATVCAGAPDDAVAGALIRELPCATTDALGGYALTGVLPGLYTVSAAAKEYAPGVHHPGGDLARKLVEVGSGGRVEGVDVTLRAGGVEVTGVITDVTGGPIARARVEAGGARTETDAAGRFSLWVEAGGIWVEASASGYSSASRGGTAPGKLSLALMPESTLAGIVVDAAGVAVAGALVAAEPAVSEGDFPAGVVSAADGRFTITGVVPGAYQVTAQTARGDGRAGGTTYVGFGAHVGGVTVTVAIQHELRISGTVMANDRPCLDATLQVESSAGEPASVVAGPAGVQTATGLAPGTYTVRASCEGFAPGPPVQIAITDRDVEGQVWRVQPGATVRGRVLTRRGDPIAGDLVSLSAGGIVSSALARTGADGRFAIVGLQAATYEVKVSHGSGELELGPLEVADRGIVERDLVIEDTGAIRGVVVSADGVPVSRIRVDAGIEGDRRWRDLTWTDDDGRFSFEGAPPGTYRVSTTPGRRDVEVTVRAGETAEVRLETEARTGVIRGTVVGADGAPIVDALVKVVSSDEDARASTGAGGAFELRSLRSGWSYWLIAYRPGGGSATVRDVPVGETVTIQIRNQGSIEGTVAGAPDPVVLEIAGPTHQTLTLSRTGGRYAFSGLPPGLYAITAKIEGQHARVEVTLGEGEQKRGVDLRVQRLTTITGQLVDATTRAPVAGLYVKLGEPGSDLIEGTEKTGADGRFSFRGQRPGTWLITGGIEELHGPTTLCAEVRRVTGEEFDAGELPVLSVRPRSYRFGFETAFLDGKHDATAWRATIVEVDAGGPAARAGLRVGDVITAVNDTDVTGPHLLLLDVLASASPSGVARMTLARGVTLTIAGTSPRDE